MAYLSERETRRLRRLTAMTLALAVLSGCAKTLPDQDLRIRAAVPVAKMTTEDLWKDYQGNERDANNRYWGRAVEISGVVTRSSKGTTEAPFLFFAQNAALGVQANLLDDDAAAILSDAVPGQRIILKCFSAGLLGNVVLKSCVKP